jgi:hypothetical protein
VQPTDDIIFHESGVVHHLAEDTDNPVSTSCTVSSHSDRGQLVPRSSLGVKQARRDDLESLAYVLMDMPSVAKAQGSYYEAEIRSYHAEDDNSHRSSLLRFPQ